MAIVADRSGNSQFGLIPDRAYCTHIRTVAGTPNAVLVPNFVGEIVWDTTGKLRWRSVGMTNADWVSTVTETGSGE